MSTRTVLVNEQYGRSLPLLCGICRREFFILEELIRHRASAHLSPKSRQRRAILRSPSVLVKLGRKKPAPRFSRMGYRYTRLATHFSYKCLNGDEPCVSLYSGVDEYNIVRFLTHETIHHVIFWLDEPDRYFNRIARKIGL
jgi:hypothetical protein